MGRCVCVTGSAGGLGQALGQMLTQNYDRVIGVDVAEADIVADLASEDGRARALEAVRTQAGGRLDGLVVAAGVGPQVGDGALIASVNYFASIAVLDGTLDLLAAGDVPAAVAISSNSSTLTPPADDLLSALLDEDEPRARSLAVELHGAIVYGTTKRALAIAVRRRAPAWGERRVRLNAVAPGAFATPLLQGGLDDPELGPLIESLPIPLGAIAEPSEIATVVDFLLSGGASYVHGSVVFVDGGTDALSQPNRVP